MFPKQVAGQDSFAVVVGGDDGEGDAPTTSQLEPVDDGCDGGGGTGS